MTESDTPLLSSLKSLHAHPTDMRLIFEDLSQVLQGDTSWSRAEIYRAGEILLDRKDPATAKGIWQSPPLMMTATLDDAIGQGLKIIHLYSRLAGMNVKQLGLMQPPDKIIEACRLSPPDILGLTILQFHSEETLCDLVEHLPSQTKVIVGGPIFTSFSREELDTKKYHVLNTIQHFINFLLTLS